MLLTIILCDQKKKLFGIATTLDFRLYFTIAHPLYASLICPLKKNQYRRARFFSPVVQAHTLVLASNGTSLPSTQTEGGLREEKEVAIIKLLAGGRRFSSHTLIT